MRHLLFFISFLAFINTSVCLAQDVEEEDSVFWFNDILLNNQFIDYGMEYYVIDSKNSFLEHHVLYQPYISGTDVVNIEMGLVASFLGSGNFVTPGDLSFSYLHIFKSEEYGESGFQGFGTTGKIVIPTGRGEYLSGEDSWTFEPQIGVQWLLNNTNWYIQIEARYNYSFAALPGKERKKDHFRLEYTIGYENTKMWLFVEPDYRFVTSTSSHTVFLAIDGGYKLNEIFGLQGKIKPRISGSGFFESLFVAGFYAYLE